MNECHYKRFHNRTLKPRIIRGRFDRLIKFSEMMLLCDVGYLQLRALEDHSLESMARRTFTFLPSFDILYDHVWRLLRPDAIRDCRSSDSIHCSALRLSRAISLSLSLSVCLCLSVSLSPSSKVISFKFSCGSPVSPH